MRTDENFPATFHDWFVAELDKSLAKLPTDQARYSHLIRQSNVWAGHAAAYVSDGTQPFVHPHYGPMGAADFTNVLGLIAGKRTALEQHRDAA